MTDKDIVIIGSGPAGLSAALYACRAGMRTAVIGFDGGTLGKVHKVDNYFGFDGSISGEELLKNSESQAKRLGAEIIKDEVLSVAWDGTFKITYKSGSLSAYSVIFATGSPRKKVRLPGVAEFEGKGVSYCAVCDGFFYRGKQVAVLGSGEYALHEAGELIGVAGGVTLLTNGGEPAPGLPDSVSVIKTPVAGLYGGEVLEGAELKDGGKVPLSGVFIAMGSAGAGDLARKLGAELNGNSIVTDNKMATNLPGLFAAGDCTGGVLQVSVAVGEGATAALSAIEFVRAAKRANG